MNLIDTRDYDALPESVKANYSLLQYLWLSDDEKGRLVQTETEPETFED
jgi:hypothetical protein